MTGLESSAPMEALPEWLARIRDNALSVADSFPRDASDDSRVAGVSRTPYAYGTLLGSIETALHELAWPAPDMARLQAILMGGYANAEAIRGQLASALTQLAEIDTAHQRIHALLADQEVTPC